MASDQALGHYTHEKSPLGAAAALATIAYIEERGLVAHARDLGRARSNGCSRWRRDRG